MAFFPIKSVLYVSLLAAVTTMTGCDKLKSFLSQDTNCSDASALVAVESQFEKGVLSASKSYLSSDVQVDSDTLQGLISQFRTKVDDIRTQSDKKSCAGTLKLTVNPAMLAQANAVRQARGDKPIKDIAFSQDINLDGNNISQDIEYQLQPTDDGKKVVATLENVRNLQNFLARLVVDASQNVPKTATTTSVATSSVVASTVIVTPAASAALATSTLPRPNTNSSTPVPAAKATGPAAVKENLGQDEPDNTDPAFDDKAIAATQQAQNRLDIKRKQFNQMWNAASPEAQDSLTDDQKQWVEERDATCNSEAEDAKAGYEEAARMQCMSRMLAERYSEVKEYFDNYE